MEAKDASKLRFVQVDGQNFFILSPKSSLRKGQFYRAHAGDLPLVLSAVVAMSLGAPSASPSAAGPSAVIDGSSVTEKAATPKKKRSRPNKLSDSAHSPATPKKKPDQRAPPAPPAKSPPVKQRLKSAQSPARSRKTWAPEEVRLIFRLQKETPGDVNMHDVLARFPGRSLRALTAKWRRCQAGTYTEEDAMKDDEEEEEEKKKDEEQQPVPPVTARASPSSSSQKPPAASASAAPVLLMPPPPAQSNGAFAVKGGSIKPAARRPGPRDKWSEEVHLQPALDFFQQAKLDREVLDDVEPPNGFAIYATRFFDAYPVEKVWAMVAAKLRDHLPQEEASAEPSDKTGSDDSED